jgi:hypothetical protein
VKSIDELYQIHYGETPPPLSTTDALRVILRLFAADAEDLEKEVWDKRIRFATYSDLRAEYQRLQRDISIVQKLLGAFTGEHPLEKPEVKKRIPQKAYGER